MRRDMVPEVAYHKKWRKRIELHMCMIRVAFLGMGRQEE